VIFDSDMHVIEPADLFTSVGIDLPGWGWNGLTLPTHRLPDAPSEWPVDPDAYTNGIAASYSLAHWDDFGPGSTIVACRREGIDAAVLFPTRASSLAGADDVPRELLIKGLGRYNDWVRDFATRGAPILNAVGAFSMQETDLAVSTVSYCGAEGFVGMVTRPNPMRGRRWDHPDYFPVYEALCKYRLPLILHEGTGAHLPTLGLDRATTYLEGHAMSHPFEAMSAVLQFTVGGIFHRFPELRVGFFESGAGWLPYWLDRLDDHALGIFGAREYRLPNRPSFYFKRQGFVTMDPSEELHGIEEAGLAANVLFASDYPHGDSIYPYSVRTARAAAGKLWGRVSWGNAERFWLPR
jgi:predicted TIM-barrel fold metal-dependent hydrolase